MEKDKIREIIEGITEKSADLTNYSLVKDRLVARLINSAANKEKLERLVSLNFFDLAIIFSIMVDQDRNTVISIPVTKKMAEEWLTDSEELLNDSINNMDMLCPPSICTITDMLRNLGSGLDEAELDTPPLYVITNQNNNFGAASILLPRVMETASDMIKENFWVIPSSIHEMLLIPESYGQDKSELENMVYGINRTQVAAEEVLSDHVYYYNIETGNFAANRIEMV